MQLLRLADIRPVLARVTGLCAADQKIADYANEAQERLLNRGNWAGSVVRFQICTSSSCLTWPRQIQNILAWANCNVPGQIRDRWYEMLPNGPGQMQDCGGCGTQLIDRDAACTFDDLWDSGSNVAVQADVPEAAGARILIQGYDQNQQWIRTVDGGSWIDGFYLTISTTLQISPMLVSSVVRVVKPVTKGMVRLWQYRDATIQKPLGFYEPDEEIPWYRRSMVPGLGCGGGSCSTDDTGTDKDCCHQVTVQAKLKHIKLVNDADWLVIQNAPAIKLMVMSVQKEEKNLIAEASAYRGLAIEELEHERANTDGEGIQQVLSVVHTSIFGGGAVENMISGRIYSQG